MSQDVLIFVPLDDPDTRRWMLMCWSHCARLRLKPVAVVHDWDDVRRLMLQGDACKVVVATRDHVGKWLEVVSEAHEPSGPTPSSRRRTGRM